MVATYVGGAQQPWRNQFDDQPTTSSNSVDRPDPPCRSLDHVSAAIPQKASRQNVPLRHLMQISQTTTVASVDWLMASLRRHLESPKSPRAVMRQPGAPKVPGGSCGSNGGYINEDGGRDFSIFAPLQSFLSVCPSRGVIRLSRCDLI